MKSFKPVSYPLRLAAAALALGTVSGCFLNPDAMPPNNIRQVDGLYHTLLRLQPAVVRPQVEVVTMLHAAKFGFGEDRLNGAEMARLVKFLQESGADHAARIDIDGPRKAAGQHDILTAARILGLSNRLTAMGLNATVPARPIDSLAKPEDAVVVTVTRAMVIEPDCEVPKSIYTPRPTHIWSCSNAVVFGRMVEDPLDLERGRTLAPGDGETLAAGVERYRTDKVKEFDVEETSGQ